MGSVTEKGVCLSAIKISIQKLVANLAIKNERKMYSPVLILLDMLSGMSLYWPKNVWIISFNFASIGLAGTVWVSVTDALNRTLDNRALLVRSNANVGKNVPKNTRSL